MKIRNMVILFTVIMLGAYLAVIGAINASQINRVDVTEINQVAKTIEQDWHAGDTEKSGKNGGISYQIALVTDENYQALLFDGIRNRQTIIDLTGTAADGQEELLGKIIIRTDGSEEAALKRNLIVMITLTFGLIMILVYLLIGRVHTTILRPFGVMKEFAPSTMARVVGWPSSRNSRE